MAYVGPLRAMTAALSYSGRGRRVEVGLGRVEALDAGGGRQHEQRDADDPDGQAHPVAAQHEPHQRPRAGAARRRGARRCGPRSHGPRRGVRRRRPAVAGVRRALELGQLVAVVAEEQLLQRGRLAASGCGRRGVARCAQRVVEPGGVDVEPGPDAVDLGVVHAGQVGEPVDRPSVSTVIDVRVRWRSSASVPRSTVRPARMMLTRSHSASTSARMWLDSSTVRPSSVDLADRVLEHGLHQRVEPRRGLVEDQQLGVRRQRGHQRHLLAVALGVGARPSWWGRARTARAARRAGPGRARRAAGPSRSMTSPPERLGHRLTSPGT